METVENVGYGAQEKQFPIRENSKRSILLATRYTLRQFLTAIDPNYCLDAL